MPSLPAAIRSSHEFFLLVRCIFCCFRCFLLPLPLSSCSCRFLPASAAFSLRPLLFCFVGCFFAAFSTALGMIAAYATAADVIAKMVIILLLTGSSGDHMRVSGQILPNL